eukprot:gene16291-22478_t
MTTCLFSLAGRGCVPNDHVLIQPGGDVDVFLMTTLAGTVGCVPNDHVLDTAWRGRDVFLDHVLIQPGGNPGGDVDVFLMPRAESSLAGTGCVSYHHVLIQPGGDVECVPNDHVLIQPGGDVECSKDHVLIQPGGNVDVFGLMNHVLIAAVVGRGCVPNEPRADTACGDVDVF